MSRKTFFIETGDFINFPIIEDRSLIIGDTCKDGAALLLCTAKDPLPPMTNTIEDIPMKQTIRIQIHSLQAARVFKHALEELVQTMELEEKAHDKNVRI